MHPTNHEWEYLRMLLMVFCPETIPLFIQPFLCVRVDSRVFICYLEL